MTRILITGENSYIGTSVEQYLMEYNGSFGEELYHVDTISLREKSWINYDFSSYDAIFHVAGIAHADVGNVSEAEKAKYYEVNCDLAEKTALKAKAEGVKQFIYMSSVIVYGESAPVGKQKRITKETELKPANFYGDSKVQAEKHLTLLADTNFQVALIRAPMIYGKGSKGNYPLLAKLAVKLPFFPNIENERSVLYVENLAEFVRKLVENGMGGVHFPQNTEYATTAQLVQMISNVKGKKIFLCKALNPFVYLAALVPGKLGKIVNKAFGSLTIDIKMENIENYQIYNLQESIERTEK